MRYLVVLAALALGACQTAQQQTAAPVPCTPDNDRASGNGICLVAHSFGAGNAGASPALYVVIHGDVSSGGPATYHLGPAEELGAPAGSVAIGLVRPGYSGKGASSEGSNNNRRDHYTEANNLAVGEAIRTLRDYYRASRTVVIGHSGGAAQTGAVIGMFPGLIDDAYLVSCPCDIPRWRSSRNASSWSSSQSPIGFVDRVAKSTRITLLTGSSDSNTAPFLAKDYVEAARKQGLDARYVEIPGGGHNFDRLWPTVKSTVTGG